MINPPKLKQKLEVKNLHNISWSDEYSYVDQKDILEVLKDPNKLLPETRKYLEDCNKYSNFHMKKTENFRKKLTREYRQHINFDDESVKFYDNKYVYWSKTSSKLDYPISLRKKIGDNSDAIEEYWNGNEEKKLHGSEFFSVGDIAVSWDETSFMGFSLDTKGSEEYTIYIRNFSDKKIISKIENTSGDIEFSLDDKWIYFFELDNRHRPKKLYRRKINGGEKELIHTESDDRYSLSLYLTSDYKNFVITSSDHTSTQQYFFSANEETPKPKLIIPRKDFVRYSVDTWKNFSYMHTNDSAEDFKVCRTDDKNFKNWIDYIPAKKDVTIGGLIMLDKYLIRSEQSNALTKLYVRQLADEHEEELVITDEEIINQGASLKQRDTNTTKIYVAYDSMKTPGKTFELDLINQKKTLIKQVKIPSKDHNPDDWVLQRIFCKSQHDGEDIPISLIYHKDVKLDGTHKLLCYSYGCYGNSTFGHWSGSLQSILRRKIIYAIAHVRGGAEKGQRWWTMGRHKFKRNTFLDYISVCRHLIKMKYTYSGGIIFYGGSAGGLLGGAVANLAPELFLSMVLVVPFVDVLNTNLNESLPLTPAEFKEIGRSRVSKEDFLLIKSYSPYEQISKKSYPHMLIRGSISDQRVLVTEPTKYYARLTDHNTSNNLLLYKVELEAGHSGKTGISNALDELAYDHSFILMTAGIKN